MTELWAIGLVVAAGLLSGIGPIYLKKGSSLIDLSELRTLLNPFLIIGLVVYGIATIMFIPALKGGELSVLYPFVGLVYVWVAVYSRLLLKERIGLVKWLGIIAILIGVGFIGAGA